MEQIGERLDVEMPVEFSYLLRQKATPLPPSSVAAPRAEVPGESA